MQQRKVLAAAVTALCASALLAAAPARAEDVVGTTEYGLRFAAAVARENLVAVQFHPEKSGRPGLTILANFLAWDGKEGADAV